MLELTYVSRPLILHQHKLCAVCQFDARQTIFLCHLHSKQAEKQHNIITTITQRWHLDRNGIKTIIQILTETTFADSLAYIHVGSSHDAHIGLSYCLTAHTDILACLKHTKKPCLSSHRKLSDLIKEDCAFVGYAEISFALAYGTCESSFLVSEKL